MSADRCPRAIDRTGRRCGLPVGHRGQCADKPESLRDRLATTAARVLSWLRGHR